MKTTTVIYEPQGRAKEYAPLACSVYSGCEHGCFYCYVPLAIKRDRADFHQNFKSREGILRKIERDAKVLSGDERPILMSFSTDPYQPIDVDLALTREAIKILHAHDLKVHVLTKGGERACRDFDLLTKRDAYAASLTLIDDLQSLKAEPAAALPSERIRSLETAKALGIPTWASLEPVIFPGQTLELIRKTYQFVDHYKVGTINYNATISSRIDWPAFAVEVRDLLESLGKSYYIKDDLKKYLEIKESGLGNAISGGPPQQR